MKKWLIRIFATLAIAACGLVSAAVLLDDFGLAGYGYGKEAACRFLATGVETGAWTASQRQQMADALDNPRSANGVYARYLMSDCKR